MPFWITLILPILSGLAKNLIERLWAKGKAPTLAGGAGAVVIFELLEQFGCNLDVMKESFIAAIPALIGAVSTGSGHTAKSFLETMATAVSEAKRPSEPDGSQSHT